MRVFRILMLLSLLLVPCISVAQQQKPSEEYKKAVEAMLSMYDPSVRETMRPEVERSFKDLSTEKLKEVTAAVAASAAAAQAMGGTTVATAGGGTATTASPTASGGFLSGSAVAIDAMIRKLWNANVRFDEALQVMERNIQSRMARQAYESYGRPEQLKLMFVIINKSRTPSYDEFKKQVEPKLVVPAGGKINPDSVQSSFDQTAMEAAVNSSYNQFRALSAIFAKELSQLRNQPELRKNSEAFRQAVVRLTQDYQRRADGINTQLADRLEQLRPSMGGGNR